MKAQSIENLFDASRGPNQGDLPSSAFYTPKDTGSLRPDQYASRPLPGTVYSTTVNHQLTTDHRKMTVSSTALNVPMSAGPLRGELKLTIPHANNTPGKMECTQSTPVYPVFFGDRLREPGIIMSIRVHTLHGSSSAVMPAACVEILLYFASN